MSRTATGAVLVSCLVALFVGPELGFGPITSTSRADTRPHVTPTATVVILTPPFIPQAALPAPPAPPAPQTAARSAGPDLWARPRACGRPTDRGTRDRGHYQFPPPARASAGGPGD